MTTQLSLAYSTCPNDTFAFYGLASGRVSCPDISFQISLADVETLNQAARNRDYDVTKLSFAAMGNLRSPYWLLKSGAALGRGCGPLIVARPGSGIASLSDAVIAVPGMDTTACLLTGLYLGKPPKAVPMTFDRIMPEVSKGNFDYGVIIHEGRFTYPEYGLVSILDLGVWWEQQTGLPVPLGCIAAGKKPGTGCGQKSGESDIATALPLPLPIRIRQRPMSGSMPRKWRRPSFSSISTCM